jgi:hypothetical protein
MENSKTKSECHGVRIWRGKSGEGKRIPAGTISNNFTRNNLGKPMVFSHYFDKSAKLRRITKTSKQHSL